MFKKQNLLRFRRMNRRAFLLVTSLITASMIVTSCNPNEKSSSFNTTANSVSSTSEKATIKVGVWFFVAEDILKFIQDNLAANEGLDIQIVKFNDWILPNTALKSGDIDANLFQNRPFMEDSAKKLNANLVLLNLSFLTPMGVYSKKFKSLTIIPSGANVGIPSDATNGDRALNLLAKNGLIELKNKSGKGLSGVKDINKNYKNIKFKEIDGPNLARALDDLDLSVFSTSVRLQAKLDLQPIAEESATEKKYAVGLVTLKGKENDPRIQKLNKLIQDPKVRDFINQKYQGAVLPVF